MSSTGSNEDDKASVRRNVLIKGKGGSKEGGDDKQLPNAKNDTVSHETNGERTSTPLQYCLDLLQRFCLTTRHEKLMDSYCKRECIDLETVSNKSFPPPC